MPARQWAPSCEATSMGCRARLPYCRRVGRVDDGAHEPRRSQQGRVGGKWAARVVRSACSAPSELVRPRSAASDPATLGQRLSASLAFRTSRHRASGRTGARARARGDRAGGYWCMTGRSVGLSLLDQRRPACPDRAKVDRWRPVPLTHALTATGAL